MNGYGEGYYNVIVTEYEPDSFEKYLKNTEIVYDKQKMNGKYQVGSGRVVAFTHDTPFIEDSLSQEDTTSQEKKRNSERNRGTDVFGKIEQLEQDLAETGKKAANLQSMIDRRNKKITALSRQLEQTFPGMKDRGSIDDYAKRFIKDYALNFVTILSSNV